MSVTQPPTLDPALLAAGELLLNGWGYNWYRRENLLRADDQLIRNRADAMLGDTLAAFRRAEAVFRNRSIGVPSRDHPLPSPESLEQLHAFQAMMGDVEALRTRLRGAAAPPADKIAFPAEAEAALLEQLSVCDLAVASLVQSLRAAALSMAPSAFAGLPEAMRPLLDDLGQALEARDAVLGGP